jgi:hypothetical protein
MTAPRGADEAQKEHSYLPVAARFVPIIHVLCGCAGQFPTLSVSSQTAFGCYSDFCLTGVAAQTGAVAALFV